MGQRQRPAGWDFDLDPGSDTDDGILGASGRTLESWSFVFTTGN